MTKRTYQHGVEDGYRRAIRDVRKLVRDYKYAFANEGPNTEYAANIRDAASYIEILIKRMVLMRKTRNLKSAQRKKKVK